MPNNIEKLRELMAIYQKSLNPAGVSFHEHKAALFDFSAALVEIAPSLIAMAEATKQLRKDQADDNGSLISLRNIKEAETEMDKALTDLEEVQL